jgi:predicted Zn-dependent peptidase
MIRVILSLSLLLAFEVVANCQQNDSTPPDPFAGFETIKLENGMKVWYKRTPDSPDAAISVAVPFGSDCDPAGKEGLAHFTEHMLFADHLGRTEQQIKREIEDPGGVYNGFTLPDHTFFFVHIGNQHGLFGLDWLYKVVSPHSMDPEIVERQREPVLQETGARRRELFDWIQALYLNPPVLRQPGLWKREFGLDTAESRDIDAFRSIHSITNQDLMQFYDAYYVPSVMTLTVIGNLDREQVVDKVRQTFGLLPSRPEPPRSARASDPGRPYRGFYWDVRANAFYQQMFKVYDPSPSDIVDLIFLSRLLGKRLNDRLRFGERKATYGIVPSLMLRGSASALTIQGVIDKDQYSYARAVIDSELDTLRGNGYPKEEFETDRSRVSRQLRTSNTSPRDLESWVLIAFSDSRVFSDYPDLSQEFERITLEEVQGLARRVLVPKREVLTITRPMPLSDGMLTLIGVAALVLLVRLVRAALISPIEMSRIKYVARFRIPIAFKVISMGFLLAFVAVTGRLVFFVCQWVADREIVKIESFWVQGSIYIVMAAGGLLLLALLGSRLPRKILVFDDRVVVKYLAYRSRAIAAQDIIEVSLRGFRGVWLCSRLWRCLPLTSGLWSLGIYLACRNGTSIFFQVRNRQEFLAVLDRTVHGEVTAARARAPGVPDR